MSQTSPTPSSASNLQAIFVASLKEYEKKTKKDLLTHPLMAQFQTGNSPTEILAVLRAQIQQFEQSASGDDKLTKWLSPTINVLYAFSSALGTGVGLVSLIGRSFYDLRSDFMYLGILTRERHLCWCRCPPLGTYRPGSPFFELF